jgi:hypothetical protein
MLVWPTGTGSKTSDGSSATDTFGDHCDEPAVVEALDPQRAGTRGW